MKRHILLLACVLFLLPCLACQHWGADPVEEHASVEDDDPSDPSSQDSSEQGSDAVVSPADAPLADRDSEHSPDGDRTTSAVSDVQPIATTDGDASPTEQRSAVAVRRNPNGASRESRGTARARAVSNKAISLSGAEESKAPPSARVPGPMQAAVLPDVLLVNDQTVRVADVVEPIMAHLKALARELPLDEYQRRAQGIVRRQIIEAVAQLLIWDDARHEIRDEIKDQLDKAVDKMEKDRINREFGGREVVYEKYLAGLGKTRTEVREMLRRTIMIDSYLRERLFPLVPQPRKDELLAYYRANLSEYSRPERREMYLLDVPIAAFLDFRGPISDSDVDAAKAKARQAIEDAAEALHQGDRFEDVARKYSHGVNKDKGEFWGFIETPLKGRWSAPYERLLTLRPGETSEIIESHKSFFIVKLGRIEGGKEPSFREVQPEIVERLRQDHFMKLRADYLQRKLDESSIGRLEEFLERVNREIPPPAIQEVASGDPSGSDSGTRPPSE